MFCAAFSFSKSAHLEYSHHIHAYGKDTISNATLKHFHVRPLGRMRARLADQPASYHLPLSGANPMLPFPSRFGTLGGTTGVHMPYGRFGAISRKGQALGDKNVYGALGARKLSRLPLHEEALEVISW